MYFHTSPQTIVYSQVYSRAPTPQGGPFSLVPKKISFVFLCSLQVFLLSLFPKISETQLLFPALFSFCSLVPGNPCEGLRVSQEDMILIFIKHCMIGLQTSKFEQIDNSLACVTIQYYTLQLTVNENVVCKFSL